MQLSTVAEASHAVSDTSSRKGKTALLADIVAAAGDHVAVVVDWLAGRLPQGKIGIGFSALSKLEPPPAPEQPALEVSAVDATFDTMAALAGPGSQAKRQDLLVGLFARATEPERAFLRGLLGGALRQGALDGVMVDAIARAYDLDPGLVRRAAMLRGSLSDVAAIARAAGAEGLNEIGLTLFRPILPMLAQSADSVDEARDGIDRPAIEYKIDGARIQVHRSGDDVAIYTRNLKDATGRMPEIVEAVAGLTADRLILDGEAVSLGRDGLPRPFQETMRRFGTRGASGPRRVHPFFFDLLHVDGVDLLDVDLESRRARLAEVVPATMRVPDADEAVDDVLGEATRQGFEGVMVKDLTSPYSAGRRGAAWVKVKPAHTLDLVVLAVEWGSGRRRGWLSNIHLGARSDDGFVMLGKTFKGMTDDMLRWQTERFLELETHREGHVVYLRPEQVVEIALDGLQASTRYPGGMALRFARVKRYRDDKTAAEADTIDTVRAIFDRSR